MVTPDITNKRSKPEYSLTRIRELAAKSKVIYGSGDVQRDISNLSYSLSDVCDCLCALEEGHYVESILYEKAAGWLDVYRRTWQLAGQQRDPLYIKLKLNNDCITIILASFHREGSL